MPTTVLLVDDHAIFRTGLLHLLEKEADMRVVGETGDGQAVIGLVRDLSPDIVVMDATASDLDCPEITQRIGSEFPHTKIMFLSTHASSVCQQSDPQPDP